MDVLTHEHDAPDPFGGDRRTMLRYGLWLRLAIAGGFVALGAGTALAHGPISLNEWVAGIAGAALAAFAWRRAKATLDAADATGSGAEAASVAPDLPRRIRIGRSADAVRSRGALAARQG